MEDMRAFFHQLAVEAKQKDSTPKTRDAVEAFIARQSLSSPVLRSGAAQPMISLTSVAARNDVRTQPYLGVSFTPLPLGTNIFANSQLHVHAAASLAALAQQKATFDADMPTSVVGQRLSQYISELAGAPHWNLVAQRQTTIRHNTTDPCQLTRDLIATVTAALNENKVDQGGIHSATNSVSLLASTLSNSTGVVDTLYATMGILREAPEAGPVFYHISFTSLLQMDHQQYRKSRSLTTHEADAFTFLFELDSRLLVQHASIYNRLSVTTVDGWFHALANI